MDQLTTNWVFTAGGEVSATPTVAGNAVYFPDWGGNLNAVRADTGALLWSRKISDYNGTVGSVSRVSPAVNGNQLIIGDNISVVHDGAKVMAIDRTSGQLLWITKVDAHPAARITGSPAVYNNTIYIGVASAEEGLATNPEFPCCTFRGSLVALNASNGSILWKTYMVPDNGGVPGGYSGNAIWSPPAVDPRRRSVYVATGNNYTVPQAVLDCQIANPNSTSCDPAVDNYFDAVVSLDLATGAIKWARKIWGFDAWTVACPPITNPPGTNCPSPFGPDFDFGSGPNLLGDIVGAGQKSGIYWALNAANGNVVWSRAVGPGGTLGGIEWGTATDGTRIYVAITNNARIPYTLPSGQTIDYGSWAALDAKTGEIVWQIPDPSGASDPSHALDAGSVSVANNVMYAGSYSGHMYAIDAATGEILWSFNSGGSVIDGPSIVNGNLYWGSGYTRTGPGIYNNKVYSFSIPKQ